MPSAADEGCCASCNPYVPDYVAPMVLLFNTFLPGSGSILAAHFDPDGMNSKCMACGVMQMLTSLIVIGWVWSII